MPEEKKGPGAPGGGPDPTQTLDEFLQALQATLESVNSTFSTLTQRLQQAQSVTQQAEAEISRAGALQFSYHFPPSSRFQEIFEARTFAYGIAQQKGPIAQELYSQQVRQIIEALSKRTTPVEQQLFGEIAHVAAKTEMAQGGLIDEYAAVLGARQKLMELKQTQPQIFEGSPIFDRLITGFAQREARLTRDLSTMVINTLQQFAQGFQTVGKTYQSVIDADVAIMGPDMGASGTPVYTKRRVDPGAMGRYIYSVIENITQIDQILSARQRRYAAVFDVQRKAQQVEYRIADLLSPLTSPELAQALQRRGIRIDPQRVFQSLNTVQEALTRAEEALRTHGPASAEFIQAHRAYAQEVQRHRTAMQQVMQQIGRLRPAELARLPGGAEVSTLMQHWQQLQRAQQVFAEGRLPLGTALRLGPVADIREALTGFTAMNLTNLQWALMFGFSGIMFQALNQIPMQATYQTLMPFYSAVGGVTGLTPLYQELASFGMQIPQFMADLAGRLTSMQALLGSRAAAQQAVQTAIQIAQVQPIQFPQAMEVLTAMAIYPSLRPYATSPRAQEEIVNAVQLLSMLAPEQGVGGALFAIREMLGGQFRSMQLRFNISPELLAGYAGVSFSEFRQMPGYEQVRVLNQALLSLFGGREILVRRGAQFDVQLRNISDSLINAVVVPLTTQVQPALAEFVTTLARTTPGGAIAGRFEESALAAILPEAQVRGISRLAQERAQRLLENEPTRVELEVRAARALGVRPEELTPQQLQAFARREQEAAIARDLYGTVSGAISLLASGINTALQATLGQGNIAGGIGNLIVQFAQSFLGDVVQAQRQIRLIQASDLPEEQRTSQIRQVGLRLVESFARSLSEGVSTFESIFSQGPVQRVIQQLQRSIERVVMATFRPIAEGMMVGTARTAIQMPGVLLGGPIANILSQAVTGNFGQIPLQEALTTMAGAAGWWSVIRYGREQPVRAGAALLGFGLIQHAIAQARTQPLEATLIQAIGGLGTIIGAQLSGTIGSRLTDILDRLSQDRLLTRRIRTYGGLIVGGAAFAHGLMTLTQPDLNRWQLAGAAMQMTGGALLMTNYYPAQIAGAVLLATGTGLQWWGGREQRREARELRETVIGDPIAQAIQDATISAQQRVAVFMRTYDIERRLGPGYAQQFQQLAIGAATAPAQASQMAMQVIEPVIQRLARGNEEAANRLRENLARTVLPTTMQIFERPREAFEYREGQPIALRQEVRLQLERDLRRAFPRLSTDELRTVISRLEQTMAQQATQIEERRADLQATYAGGALGVVVSRVMEEALYGRYRIEPIPREMIQDWTRTAELQERLPTFFQQFTTTAFTGLAASRTAFRTLPLFNVFSAGESIDLWKQWSIRLANLTQMGAIDFGEWMRRPELFRWTAMGLVLAGRQPREFFREPALQWFERIEREMTKGERTIDLLQGRGAPFQAASTGLNQVAQSAQTASSALNNLAQSAQAASGKQAVAQAPTQPTQPSTSQGWEAFKENVGRIIQGTGEVISRGASEFWENIKRGGAAGLRFMQQVLSPQEVYAAEAPLPTFKPQRTPKAQAQVEPQEEPIAAPQTPFQQMLQAIINRYTQRFRAAQEAFNRRVTELSQMDRGTLIDTYLSQVETYYAGTPRVDLERILTAAHIRAATIPKKELAEDIAALTPPQPFPEMPKSFYDEEIARRLFKAAPEPPRSKETGLPLPDTPAGWAAYALGGTPVSEIPYSEPIYRIRRPEGGIEFTNIGVGGPTVQEISMLSQIAAPIAKQLDIPLSQAEAMVPQIIQEQAAGATDIVQAITPVVQKLSELGAPTGLSMRFALEELRNVLPPEPVAAISQIKPPEQVTAPVPERRPIPEPARKEDERGIINASVVNVYAR